ncbi:MAG TPA: pilus assembly protein PilP [Gammaproteobacteria bacterium]|nr:pilus assembly protein PilP [Gammaproteobacteria bacterium]
MMASRRMQIGALAIMVMALSACSSDISDLERFVAAEKAKRPGPIEPLPQVQPYETYTYQAQNLRSPFVPESQPDAGPVVQAQNGSGIQPDFNRNREYLESFPLDALKMVGTIEAGGRTYAVVVDADGAVHRVRPGNYLGQNHGRIVSISDTTIAVTEIIPDGLGGWMERQAAVSLGE